MSAEEREEGITYLLLVDICFMKMIVVYVVDFVFEYVAMFMLLLSSLGSV